MPMRLFWLFVFGTVGFVLISYFEQVPILGWLGAVVSVVAWITLGRELAQDGDSATITSGILGAWTGFVGAFTAWAFPALSRPRKGDREPPARTPAGNQSRSVLESDCGTWPGKRPLRRRPTRPRMPHRSRVACSRSGYAAPLVGHVVDENVFAEMLRLNVEGTPVVDLRHLIDEVDEVMTAGEHEGIDRDALACAADHLA